MRNTRADVVSAALRVLDSQGLEGCSMRRVAAELDVQPSALYHHVPNKQSLLALMADEIVARVGRRFTHPRSATSTAGAAVLPEPPVSEAAADEARELCIELRDAMLSVRDGADVVATATAFRLGMSDVEALLASRVGRDGARTLLLFTFGHAQSTQTHQHAAEFGALLDAPAGGGGAGGSEPHPEEALAAGASFALDASFERGLDIILAGLIRD